MRKLLTISQAAYASGYSRQVLERDLGCSLYSEAGKDGKRMIDPLDLLQWMDWKQENSWAEHNAIRVAIDILEDMNAI